MVNEDWIIQRVSGICVRKYGSDYNFDTPAAFIKVSNEPANSFAWRAGIEVYVVYKETDDFNQIVSGIEQALKTSNDIYIYSIQRQIEGEEILTNGYYTKQVVITILYEEVD